MSTVANVANCHPETTTKRNRPNVSVTLTATTRQQTRQWRSYRSYALATSARARDGTEATSSQRTNHQRKFTGITAVSINFSERIFFEMRIQKKEKKNLDENTSTLDRPAASLPACKSINSTLLALLLSLTSSMHPH